MKVNHTHYPLRCPVIVIHTETSVRCIVNGYELPAESRSLFQCILQDPPQFLIGKMIEIASIERHVFRNRPIPTIGIVRMMYPVIGFLVGAVGWKIPAPIYLDDVWRIQ